MQVIILKSFIKICLAVFKNIFVQPKSSINVIKNKAFHPNCRSTLNLKLLQTLTYDLKKETLPY